MEYFIYYFQVFLLIFSRMLAFFSVVPVISSSSFSTQARLGLVFLVTIVIFPLVVHLFYQVPDNMLAFFLFCLGEAIIGIFFGFLVAITFSLFQTAGQFFTIQMGFGASEVFDPLSQISIPIMGNFLYFIAIMVFLSLKGPLMLINGIYQSYLSVTVFDLAGKTGLFVNDLIVIFKNMFRLSLIIAFPLVGTLLLVTLSTGLLAKAAPQMNLLIIGFPISISVAFILILVTLPAMVYLMNYIIERLFIDLRVIIKGFALTIIKLPVFLIL